MNTEKHQENPYIAVLKDLRAKRAEIDSTIKVLEGLAGVKPMLASVPNPPLAVPFANTPPSNDKPSKEALGEGAFLGMSIVDATTKLLDAQQRKMRNPEIARELAAGGLVMKSADPVNTVGAVLSRQFNKGGNIVKVARGTWGLKKWYPNQSFKPKEKSVDDKAASEGTTPDLDDLLG